MEMTKVDEVIGEILVELDTEQAQYQRLYERFYGVEDRQAKVVHDLLVELCKKIRKETALRERQ